jgi:copper(I)-binding protein
MDGNFSRPDPDQLIMRLLPLVAVAAILGLAGCGSTEATVGKPPAPITVRDPWVKAAGSEMTSVFGTLVNNTGKDIVVLSATSSVSPMELHEMIMQGGTMVMRPKPGGFVLKAGGSEQLSPGGDHLMLMQPIRPIRPGDELSVTLNLSDGTRFTFSAIAKPYAGADESYAPS